jgi:hypothetical protein
LASFHSAQEERGVEISITKLAKIMVLEPNGLRFQTLFSLQYQSSPWGSQGEPKSKIPKQLLARVLPAPCDDVTNSNRQ